MHRWHDVAMEQRTIVVGHESFAAIESGVGGRPLLLVHGFTGAKEDFADHLDALADLGWWVVAPDHRGHGASGKPDDESAYSLAILGADVVSWVDGLGWDRLVLLGHSMGGMAVQIAAVSLADRLDGLILMDTSDRPLDMDRDLVLFGAEVARKEGIVAMKALLDSLDEGALETPANRRLMAERPGFREFSDEKFLASSPAMYAAMLASMLDAPARTDSLAQFSVPTLVMVGEQDKPFLDAAHRMAHTIPDARLVVIADAGHSPQFEAPDAWFEAMRSFLADR